MLVSDDKFMWFTNFMHLCNVSLNLACSDGNCYQLINCPIFMWTYIMQIVIKWEVKIACLRVCTCELFIMLGCIILVSWACKDDSVYLSLSLSSKKASYPVLHPPAQTQKQESWTSRPENKNHPLFFIVYFSIQGFYCFEK